MSRTALADDPSKEECISASEKLRDLRAAKKLRSAREQALICVAQSCPQMIRDDCAQNLASLDSATPKIIFEAKAADGSDLSAVKVTMDGSVLAERLDGSPIAVDPGPHSFRFETTGLPASEKTYVISEGDQVRRERVVIGSPPPAPSTESTVHQGIALQAETTPPAEEASSTWSGQKTWALVAGGVGLVGVGLGTAFGLSARSKWSSAKADCGTACAADSTAETEKSDAQSAATAATIAFVLGGVGLAGAGVLWLTAPSKARSAAALQLVPSVGFRTSGVILKASF